MTTLSRRAFCQLLLSTAAFPALAAAEGAWPSRTVKFLVPGGTGGVSDVRARWLAARLTAVLGQPFQVENRPGAGGIVGTEAGAKAPADGYTLLLVHQGTIAINPHLYPQLPYDPLSQLAYVTRLGHGALVMVANPALGVNSVSELVALARTRPLNFGSPGIGTPPHMATELFMRDAKFKATHIPYKGGGQAASDLIAGHVDFSIEGLSVMAPHVKSGRVKGLAVTTRARSPAFPELPTVSESGIPGYEYEGWVGLAVPAATTPAVIDQVYQGISKVLGSAESREWFAQAAADPGGERPAVFTAFVREEHAKWGKVIRDNAIKAE